MSSNERKGVNVLDPKELLLYAQDTSDKGRLRLATAVSSFFDENQLNETEQRLAGEILMNLVRQAETDLREALAERLALQENIPSELILFFANDQISVASKVLTHSPVLKDIDLFFVIQSQGEEHWRAIAQRPEISPAIAERLIDTHDPATVLELVNNQRVHLQKGAMKKIFRAATVSEELQAPLLRRPEVDAEMATNLYMIASNALRKEVAERFPITGPAVERAFEILMQELTNEARGRSDVSHEMTALARKFRERDEISADLLIKTLRRGQMGFFIALFGEKMDFPVETVTRMIRKEGGKPFILACRAAGMMKSEFASLFLLSRGIRTGDKIVDQRELAMALKYYDALKDFDVGRIIESWRKNNALV